MKKIFVCLLLVCAMLLPLKAAVPSLRPHADGEECCGHCGQAVSDKESEKDSESTVHSCCAGRMAAMAASLSHAVAAADRLELRNLPQKCGCKILPDDGAPVNEPLRLDNTTMYRLVSLLPVMQYHGISTNAMLKVRPPPWHRRMVNLHDSISTTILLN